MPIKPFLPRELGPKDWGTETLVAQSETYIGKVLRMRAGASGPLQYHVHKDETFYLFEGVAIVGYLDWANRLREVEMQAGESFHVEPGSTHKVTAVTDCIFFEASTPHFDDRVHVDEPSDK